MKEKNKITYTSFNQGTDANYFLIGTKDGCTLYQADPFKKGLKLSKLQLKIISIYNI